MMKIYITQLVGVINTYTHRYIKHIRTYARANTNTRGSKYKTRGKHDAFDGFSDVRTGGTK